MVLLLGALLYRLPVAMSIGVLPFACKFTCFYFFMFLLTDLSTFATNVSFKKYEMSSRLDISFFLNETFVAKVDRFVASGPGVGTIRFNCY